MELVTTPGGHEARFVVRPDTSDLAVVGSTCGLWGHPPEDEYGIGQRPITGVFWDIGAHIGAVAVAVLLDNPDARAVLVEPLKDNLNAIEANLAENGLTDRATVLAGAVGTSRIGWDWATDRTNRYIGNLSHQVRNRTMRVRRYSIADLLEYGTPELVKIDCEGGEYGFLDDPDVALLGEIVGEYHGSQAKLLSLLGATHDVEIPEDVPTGLFRATRQVAA